MAGVRREALRRIPGPARRNLEECSWVNGLPGGESPRGQQHAVKAVATGGVRRCHCKTRAIWSKLHCLLPNLQLAMMGAHRNDA